jgi:transposase
MAKRQFHITEEQETELKIAYDTCKDATLSKKLLAIRLYGTGRAVAEIRDLVGYCRSSLLGWCQQYSSAGLAGLVDKRNGGNHHKLTPAQKADLREKLHRYTPREVLGEDTATASGAHWTTADVKQAIFHWYEVIYRSHGSYLLLLGECGFSYQRTESVFKSRSEAKVADFEEQLEKN